MSWFSWSNWARFYKALWGLQGPRALPEAALRAGMGLLHGATWALGQPAPPASRALLIVGHQRSGTTWLHRMLSACAGAVATPLHALAFPADAIQTPLEWIRRPAWFDRAQDRLFGALDPLHRIRLHEHEEDEFLLWALFRSPMNALDRPWPPDANPGVEGDPIAMDFYARAIARRLRRAERTRARALRGRSIDGTVSGALTPRRGDAEGAPGADAATPERSTETNPGILAPLWYVGKNPHFTHRIPALRAAIPGIRVVQLVRDPCAAIPSRLSLIRAIWRRRFPGIRALEPHQIQQIYQNSLRCYRGGHGAADLDLAYADLVSDPIGSVDRILALMDLDPADPDLVDRLSQTRRSGATPHRYTLEEFGLSRPRIAADLAPIFERWGFPRA